MICLFDKSTQQNKFDSCGIRILKPASCKVYESLNGEYYLELQYIISDYDDSWRDLQLFNIIKITNGQLFVIYRTEISMTGGLKIIKVYANHIWYYLSKKLVTDCSAQGFSCYWALARLKEHTQIYVGGNDSGYTEYDFSFGSDIDKLGNIDYNMTSAANAILGADNSIVNVYGGELHRDNFRYTVNSRKEGSYDDAFEITHGMNMLEIRETIDASDMITALSASDNYGNSVTSWYPGVWRSPNHIMHALELSYNGESRLESDMGEYFYSHNEPAVTYSVKFEDFVSSDHYGEWARLQRYKVGDAGRIRSDALGISTTQKIISTVFDEINQKNESAVLGNFVPSLVRRSKFDNMIAKKDSPGKRLDVVEHFMRGISNE